MHRFKNSLLAATAVGLFATFGAQMANAATICAGCEVIDGAAGTYLGTYSPSTLDEGTFSHTDIQNDVGFSTAFEDFLAFDLGPSGNADIQATYPQASAILTFAGELYADGGSTCASGTPATCSSIVLGSLIGSASDVSGSWEIISDGLPAGRYIIRVTGTTPASGSSTYSGQLSSSAGTVSIAPNTDPGGLMVGDSLTFTVSVDSVATPGGGATWNQLSLFTFRIIGPADGLNFSGDCEDLSLLGDTHVSCNSNSNGGTWDWVPQSDTATNTVSGNLVSFTALFDQAGTYNVYLERGLATFENPHSTRELTVTNHDLASSIVITVSETPETLLQLLLEEVTDQVPGKSLRNKVALAQTYYAADDIPATCAVLADFIKQVKAQMGKKKIATTLGDKLITDATAIMTAIGCT